MHDPRIGRFFAVDPLAPDYPWNSPYAFCENDVITFIELEGLERGFNVFHSSLYLMGNYKGAQEITKIKAETFKDIQIQVKLGVGSSVGVGAKLGPVQIEAYNDGGTYSVGYNTSDGEICEYAEGAGGKFFIFGGENEVTEAYAQDGRAQKANTDRLLIYKSMGKSSFLEVEDERTMPLSIELPDKKDYPYVNTGTGTDMLRYTEWENENTKKTQDGPSTHVTNYNFGYGFDVRVFVRLNVELKKVVEDDKSDSNEFIWTIGQVKE